MQVTELQNGWSWKGPLQVTWSHPLLKQGCLEPVFQDSVQMAFEHLQGWGFHSLPGQSVPVLGHSQSFLMFRWSLLCFHLCPLPLILSLKIAWLMETNYSSCIPLLSSIAFHHSSKCYAVISLFLLQLKRLVSVFAVLGHTRVWVCLVLLCSISAEATLNYEFSDAYLMSA